jgi:hypothetical protein
MFRVLLLALSLQLLSASALWSQTPDNTAAYGMDKVDSTRNTIPNTIINQNVPSQPVGSYILQAITGPALGWSGLVIGGLIGWGIGEAFSTKTHEMIDDGGMAGMIIGGVGIGLPMCSALAAGGIGRFFDGWKIEGSYGPAIAGSYIGTILDIGLALSLGDKFFFGSNNDKEASAVIVVMSFLPTIGAIIGYETSRQWSEDYIRSSQYNKENIGLNVSLPSVSMGQNPYKLTPQSMPYLNVLNVQF